MILIYFLEKALEIQPITQNKGKCVHTPRTHMACHNYQKGSHFQVIGNC